MKLGGILKFGVIALGVLIVIGIIIATNQPEPPESTPIPFPTRQPIEESAIQAEPTPTPKDISYTTINRGTLGTGAGGIVIPIEYLNEDDMAALGEKLKVEYSNDKNVSVRVFTDNRAYALFDKIVSQEATPEEDALYTKNFVGWYKKNGNNGLHEFDTFIDGVLGEHKTITY